MNKVNIIDASGSEIKVPEQNFQKALIGYMREFSPNHVKVIAETRNTNGQPAPVPTVICMLAKNPEQIRHYTDVLPLEVKSK